MADTETRYDEGALIDTESNVDSSSGFSISKVCRLITQFLVIKHTQRHVKAIFDGALPVFVASTITRAVLSLIEAIAGPDASIDTIVKLNFVYSLFFAHLIGLFVTIYVPTSSILSRYINRVACENANFSWNQTLTLLILKGVFSGSNYGEVVSIWVASIAMTAFIIYLSSYIQVKICHNSPELMAKLSEFDGEVFSLPIAFALTIIITSAVFTNASTNYLTNTDDKNSLKAAGEVDDIIDTSLTWLYILYALFLTVVVAALQAYGWKALSRKICFCLYRRDEYEAVKIHSAHTSSFSQDHPLGRRFNWLQLCGEKCDFYLFKRWDPAGYTKATFVHLFSTTCAYLVGCAWYAWSILSFQNYFTFIYNGEVFGQFLFGLAVSMLLVFLLDKLYVEEVSSIVQDSLGDHNMRVIRVGEYSQGHIEHDEEFEHSLAAAKVRGELVLVSGRLTVGWAWGQFVSSCIGVAVPEYNDSRVWFHVIAKFVTASAFAVLGGVADVYLRKINKSLFRRNKSTSPLSPSAANAANGYNGASTMLIDGEYAFANTLDDNPVDEEYDPLTWSPGGVQHISIDRGSTETFDRGAGIFSPLRKPLLTEAVI